MIERGDLLMQAPSIGCLSITGRPTRVRVRTIGRYGHPAGGERFFLTSPIFKEDFRSEGSGQIFLLKKDWPELSSSPSPTPLIARRSQGGHSNGDARHGYILPGRILSRSGVQAVHHRSIVDSHPNLPHSPIPLRPSCNLNLWPSRRACFVLAVKQVVSWIHGSASDLNLEVKVRAG